MTINKYFISLLQAAFDHSYSVGILRVTSGLDFSAQINAVETESEDADGKLTLVSQDGLYLYIEFQLYD